ncbi:MAG TPA: hypothetical protein VEK38_02720, partial [Candidatus Bathyarchaeia archaeon]|nr:hypothetical protein [Candidatus Bathyarchaeia archaeon]
MKKIVVYLFIFMTSHQIRGVIIDQQYLDDAGLDRAAKQVSAIIQQGRTVEFRPQKIEEPIIKRAQELGLPLMKGKKIEKEVEKKEIQEKEAEEKKEMAEKKKLSEEKTKKEAEEKKKKELFVFSDVILPNISDEELEGLKAHPLSDEVRASDRIFVQILEKAAFDFVRIKKSVMSKIQRKSVTFDTSYDSYVFAVQDMLLAEVGKNTAFKHRQA